MMILENSITFRIEKNMGIFPGRNQMTCPPGFNPNV